MTRAEHIDWTKARALEYLDRGEAANAVSSFTSDLNKSEETARLSATVGYLLMGCLFIGDTHVAKSIIQDFL